MQAQKNVECAPALGLNALSCRLQRPKQKQNNRRELTLCPQVAATAEGQNANHRDSACKPTSYPTTKKLFCTDLPYGCHRHKCRAGVNFAETAGIPNSIKQLVRQGQTIQFYYHGLIELTVINAKPLIGPLTSHGITACPETLVSDLYGNHPKHPYNQATL